MSFPKVLILNQPFVTNTGGGITLTNLFKGWDKDCLAVACSGYALFSYIDPEICNNYYQLGYKERKWMFPLNLLRRKYYSGPIKLTDNSKENIVENTSKAREGFATTYLFPFMQYLNVTHVMTKTTLSKEFCSWLDDYAPDVIYAQCSSREGIRFCLAVEAYLKKPVVFHMMDDWPALIGQKGFMKNYWRKKVDKEFRKLIDVTAVPMAISDYMGTEYQRRYGKKFLTFHNPIDSHFWEQGQRKTYELPKRPTVLYAGRIGLGIDKSLQTIAKAVALVNTQHNIPLQFVIQAKSEPLWIKAYKNTVHQTFSAYDQLPYIFGGADLLILPYDFDTKGLTYIKYSMPTKASEYMASGTPIIIFAPEDTALAHYATNDQWATLVSVDNVKALAATFYAVLQNEAVRKNSAAKAKMLAKERHDNVVVSKNFQAVLKSVVQ